MVSVFKKNKGKDSQDELVKQGEVLVDKKTYFKVHSSSQKYLKSKYYYVSQFLIDFKKKTPIIKMILILYLSTLITTV